MLAALPQFIISAWPWEYIPLSLPLRKATACLLALLRERMIYVNGRDSDGFAGGGANARKTLGSGSFRNITVESCWIMRCRLKQHINS